MSRSVFIASSLFVAAALVAPTALAQRPDDRAGTIGVGSVTAPATEVVGVSTRPDDQADPRGPGAISGGLTTILVSSDGFDWGDAGVGVAGGLGLALLAGGLLAVAAHRHRAQRLA
jgi:hypothetical protein